MKELEINAYLTQENLLELFKQQLRKDFESSGYDAAFVDTLPLGFDQIKLAVKQNISETIKLRPSLLPILLYRIDLSELQIRKYQKEQPQLDFEEAVSELIIKRVLQKVILKKSFSGK